MKKVSRYIWSVKHIILAVLSVIFVSAAAYSQNSATDLINEGTLKVPYTLSDGTVLPSPEAAKMRRYVDHPVA